MNRSIVMSWFRSPITAVVVCHVLLLAASALAAEPQYILGIAARDAQTIFLADRQLPGVWQMTDGKLSLFFEGSKKFRTPLNAVRCLAIDREGRLLAGDSSTREVYRFNAENRPEPLTKGGIGIPTGIAVNAAGEILVADLETHRIWKVPGAGGEPSLFAEVAAPRAIVFDGEARLWIVSHGKDQLLRANPEGKLEVAVAGRPFEFPSAVLVDPQGAAYVCDTYAKAIWKVTPGKPPEKWASGEPLVSPVGLAWSSSDMLVADPRAKGVVRIDQEGKMTTLPFAQ